MSDLPDCPECNSKYTYEDRDMFVCPESVSYTHLRAHET